MDLRLPGRSGGRPPGDAGSHAVEALLWGEGRLDEVEGVVAADIQLEDGCPGSVPGHHVFDHVNDYSLI